MQLRSLALLLLLLVSTSVFGQQSVHEHNFPAAKTTWQITPADVAERIAVLASDSLEGRRTGTYGALKAARYIKSEFERMHLTSVTTDVPYLQFFTFSEHAIDTTKRDKTQAMNVVALVPGSDPTLKNEYVVVGAHYDHLGWGDRHFALDTVHAIHYGADDNASGVAGLLEMAEYLSHEHQSLKRSILFIAFSGEEEGLFGSDYFVEHPLVPLANVVAMLNMDMIGRMEDSTLIVEGTGTSPAWKDILPSLPEASTFHLKMNKSGRGPSDHEKFYFKNLPVLFFFTGFHPDYHKATDTKEKINSVGEARIVKLAEGAVLNLANRTDRIAFTLVASDTGQKSTSFRVYVGGVPDYGYDGEGLRISDVTAGSPAQTAGFQKGDVIIEFGGQPIHNIYDYTDALSKHKPGEEVIAVILRKEVKMSLKVVLGTRSADH